jgi:hypothetical protein
MYLVKVSTNAKLEASFELIISLPIELKLDSVSFSLTYPDSFSDLVLSKWHDLQSD